MAGIYGPRFPATAQPGIKELRRRRGVGRPPPRTSPYPGGRLGKRGSLPPNWVPPQPQPGPDIWGQRRSYGDPSGGLIPGPTGIPMFNDGTRPSFGDPSGGLIKSQPPQFQDMRWTPGRDFGFDVPTSPMPPAFSDMRWRGELPGAGVVPPPQPPMQWTGGRGSFGDPSGGLVPGPLPPYMALISQLLGRR